MSEPAALHYGTSTPHGPEPHVPDHAGDRPADEVIERLDRPGNRADGGRPAVPAALDVERLARAMRFVYDDPDLFVADVMDNATVPGAWTEIATALAREYAALPESSDD